MYQHAIPATEGYHSVYEYEEAYQRGCNFWNEGNHSAALDCFAHLAISQPFDRRFLFAFACSLEVKGETQHALNIFMYALSMEKDDPWTYFHIACCLNTLGHIVEARDALDITLKITDTDMTGQGEYGYVQQRAQAMFNQLAY